MSSIDNLTTGALSSAHRESVVNRVLANQEIMSAKAKDASLKAQNTLKMLNSNEKPRESDVVGKGLLSY